MTIDETDSRSKSHNLSKITRNYSSLRENARAPSPTTSKEQAEAYHKHLASTVLKNYKCSQ